jgi:hypothetical protein
MLSDWVSFLAYHNLFRIKGFVVVVVDLLFLLVKVVSVQGAGCLSSPCELNSC